MKVLRQMLQQTHMPVAPGALKHSSLHHGGVDTRHPVDAQRLQPGTAAAAAAASRQRKQHVLDTFTVVTCCWLGSGDCWVDLTAPPCFADLLHPNTCTDRHCQHPLQLLVVKPTEQ
jgi:hypothetical protein